MSRLTMFSPSSSTRNFTVPCVAGCDGPMLSTWCSVCRSRSKSSSERSGASGKYGSDMLVPRADQRLAPLLRVVLAQRMPFELPVEQDAAQIGMTVEADAVQVPDLAFHPVRRGVERRRGVDARVVGRHAHLDAHAVIARERIEVVDDLEARPGGQQVDRAQIREHDEVELAVVA